MSLFDSGLITYDKSTAEEILSLFIKDIDEEGYITEDGVRVRALDGGTIKKDEIAGMIDGKFISRPGVMRGRVKTPPFRVEMKRLPHRHVLSMSVAYNCNRPMQKYII